MRRDDIFLYLGPADRAQLEVPYAKRNTHRKVAWRAEIVLPRDIYLVLDKYATHKTPEVMASFEKHPCFKLHFTPTSASWMNLVERFFAKITTRRIRRGSYASVDDLETAIYGYLLQ